VRVLYVNHTGAIGGAEWSLLELIEGMRGRVDVGLACPAGELLSAAGTLDVPTFTIRPVSLGFRPDAVGTVRGVVGALGATFDIARTARGFRADLVHANSVRAGIAAIGARAAGAPAPLVHVRDALPQTAPGRIVASLVTHGALFVLANSHYTATRLRMNGTASARIIHNSVDLDRFRPVRGDRAGARKRVGLDADSAVLGVIAQITPWKAQDDAIRTLALVRRRRPDTKLVLVGEAKFRERSTSYDNVSYEASLLRLAESLDVVDAVRFLGERRDVPELMRALDILLVPSWHEPFGRSMIEAMAVGTPVIATRIGGPSEVIESGETGLLLPPKSPELWAEAVLELLDDPGRRARLAKQAAETVRARFARERQIETVAAVYREAYEELIGRGRR